MPSGQWHKSNRQQQKRFNSPVLILCNEQQLLDREWRADGDHHASSRFELLYQWGRYVTCGRSHKDAVKGRGLGPTVIAVADFRLDLAVAQALQRFFSLLTQFLDNLDCVNLCSCRIQHGRLITRSCSNLEYGVTGFQVQQVAHQGDDIGLRDCLAIANRERFVEICAFSFLNWYKLVPGNIAHCIHYNCRELARNSPTSSRRGHSVHDLEQRLSIFSKFILALAEARNDN